MPIFPHIRHRRLRLNENVRRLVRENHLSVDDLIYPVFVTFGQGIRREVPSMPGVYNLSIDMLLAELKQVEELGIPGILVFGIPEEKDEVGSGAYATDGIVQQAVRAVKQAYPNMLVITDVCLCEYTSHGHCGLIKDNTVDNDLTLELIAKTALSHVEAGADMVAPSDMMDGRVAAIREKLDAAGYTHIPIMAYSAKYASAYYGPFREAADSAPQFGDRKTYQMDPANGDEAIRETRQDIEEGADIVMVKPALAFMDIIRRVKDEFNYPVCAYNVSGEYAMIKAASRLGWIDEQSIVLETLTGFKRAGADMIITYHAIEVARWLKGGR
ncbi:Porphobilinogen synthase [Desulfotomaculum nigrificans CO-1-SRB]|uniref:Delta-aminolevulinic acid dehydratase n=1 Tax=Desulfotomaculum nigrificans (strain DSM 14880 / VKM B-2319 / CO-1-SRB) TaxID=868595 RepID=F6B6M2_DESCC|nr:porphobilinogen synthase [Desulfotomaculum nigrificans]AEF94396.1 Porphobilinogen synthase [Desulfotomaculum nigrificans CO-1-SRB]